MYQRALVGFTGATELANLLVLHGGIPFRRAHFLVGEMVRDASLSGQPLEPAAAGLLREHGVPIEAASLDPATVAERSAFGGGPARSSTHRVVVELELAWTRARAQLAEEQCRWRNGDRALDLAVALITNDERLATPS
jgi:argininosuccinate lyase